MTRLDAALSESLKLSRNQIAKLIENGLILVNDKIQKPSYKLKKEDKIFYDINQIDDFFEEKPLEPYEFKLDIKYEDNDVIVLNKPKNLLTHPTKYERNKTLCNALIFHTKNLSDIDKNRPGIVHRLDKNTAGIMVVVKNNEAHKILSQQIKEKKAKRKYLALTLGDFKDDFGTIDKALKHYIKDDIKMKVVDDDEGLKAITNYKVVERFDKATLVELELKTGRTHQIRAHMAYLNHPVWGDSLYGANSVIKQEYKKLKTTQQLLQSYYLSFYHPKTNELMEFQLKEDEFSEDFIKVLKFLRSNL